MSVHRGPEARNTLKLIHMDDAGRVCSAWIKVQLSIIPRSNRTGSDPGIVRSGIEVRMNSVMVGDVDLVLYNIPSHVKRNSASSL